MFKDVVVHLDATPSSERRLEAAILLAEREEGHVIGLHVNSAYEELVWAQGAAVDLVLRYAEERAATEREAVEALFRRTVAGHAVASEWRAVSGPVDRTVALHARYADLAVLGQRDPRDPRGGSAALVPETVPMTSGRPALIVPYAGGLESLGERVLVAWNGTRESARAVGDALPILKLAGTVTVVSVGRASGVGGSGDVPAADLAAHLARHGVRVEAHDDVAAGIEVGDLLLSLASDLSADLIVMGAYGHSRARELVLGGVTRAMLDHMTLPILMSH